MPKGVYLHKKVSNSGSFKKGLIPHNKGKRGYSTSKKGKKYPQYSGVNHYNFGRRYKGKPRPDIKGRIPWNKGLTKETDERIALVAKNNLWKSLSEKHKENLRGERPKTQGANHHNWQGGISENPYPKKFNSELKLKIRTRDNFICCLCGKTEREELEELNRVLCVNHIDFDKNNLSEKNLNTLCIRCNIKINREREYWTLYFQ